MSAVAVYVDVTVIFVAVVVDVDWQPVYLCWWWDLLLDVYLFLTD